MNNPFRRLFLRKRDAALESLTTAVEALKILTAESIGEQRALRELLESAIEPAPAAPVYQIENWHAKLPRVAVVGLMPRTQRMFEGEFGRHFDLRMFEASQAKGRAFMDHIAHCDRVLVMRAWNGHAATDCVRSAGLGDSLIVVEGGTTQLREALTRLHVELSEAIAA